MAIMSLPAARGGAALPTVGAGVVAAGAFVVAALGGSGLELYRTTGMTLGREALTSLLTVPSASLLILLYLVLVPTSLVMLATTLWRRDVALRWSAGLLVLAALLHVFGSAAVVGGLALPLLALLAVRGSPTAP